MTLNPRKDTTMPPTPKPPAETPDATHGVVYDTGRDLYVNPETGEEDPGCRQRRLIEESSLLAWEGGNR